MSTHSGGFTKPESEEISKPESEKQPKKIHYCEICKVPCLSSMSLQIHLAGIKHKKKEQVLNTKRVPVVYEEPLSARKLLSNNIKCLKDYIKDPGREPLIGLEYVVEIRFKGKKEPSYECQLCMFNTSSVPMIEHLTGQRHRKAYLMKHYPDKAERQPNNAKEDKATFFRRIAGEVEKTEGLKMYKSEVFARPSKDSTASKKKAARFGSGFKLENDPVRRERALEYMENFEITSDEEAALVISIAQSLSEDLKTFCRNKATLNHIKNLPPLIPPGPLPEKQCKPMKPFGKYKDHHRGDSFTESMMVGNTKGDSKWNHGYLSNGLAQLQSLLQHGRSTSPTPPDLYSCEMGGKASSFDMSSNDLATMSALKSSFGKVHQSGLGGGINEWMKQFNQSASAHFQSTSDVEEPSCFTPPQNSYAIQHHHQHYSSKVLGNRTACSKARNWDSMQDSYDSRTYLESIISQPPSITHQGNLPSWFGDGSGNGNQVSVPSFSSESGGPGWPQQLGLQQSNFEGDLRPYPSFGGGSLYSNYQQPNSHLNNVIGECGNDFTANIMSQLQGKDAATLTSMLLQLVPHYPDLQRIDIHALAQTLSEMN